MGFLDRLQHGINAFMNKDPTLNYQSYGSGSSYRPDRPRLTRGNERSIVTAIYNRIAMDVAAISIRHCRLDKNGRYLEDIDSHLNNCLNTEANIDQTARAFIQDYVMSMLDEGVVALVPIDTTLDPMDTSSYDILSMRTGKIVQWYPQCVRVSVYNDRTGEKEEITLPKNRVGIVENPLYAVINEPNATMQRLIRKLALLDIVDEKTSSGKLDLIIQLPYIVKTQAKREQAEQRRKDIEMQLTGSTYGIAYTDGTERITQLNRPVENNLLKQIEYLTNLVYSQMGFDESILNGTADEKTMLNYKNRIIEPIVSAFVDEIKRKFLTKTARTQSQTIMFFSDPFKLVPINNIAEIADKFTRNEIMTSNEIRQIVGLKPSNDPKADELRNSNLNHPDEGKEGDNSPMTEADQTAEETGRSPKLTSEQYQTALKELDDYDEQLDAMEKSVSDKANLKHYASPYYDPVKAHEYYMKNRELKQRKSTSTLNDEGKAVAEYAKNQLDTERQTKVNDSNTATQAQISANRSSMQSEVASKKEDMTKKMESHSESMNSKIDKLQEELEEMTKANKEYHGPRIQSQIEKLREDNESMRAELQENYSKDREELQSNFRSASESLRSDHKATVSKLKEEYEEKYLSELNKIKSNAQYIKSTKKSNTTT